MALKVDNRVQHTWVHGPPHLWPREKFPSKAILPSRTHPEHMLIHQQSACCNGRWTEADLFAARAGTTDADGC